MLKQFKVEYQSKNGKEKFTSDVYHVSATPSAAPNPLNPKSVQVSMFAAFLVKDNNGKPVWVSPEDCRVVTE